MRKLIYSILSLLIFLQYCVMAQETPAKLNPSHQEATLPTKKSLDNDTKKDLESIKVKDKQSKAKSENQFDWTKIVPLIIGLGGFIFGIYQYVKRRQIHKEKKTAELEAEDEHKRNQIEQARQTDEVRYKDTLREEIKSIRILGSPDIQNLPVHLLDAFVSLDISETWRSESLFDPQKKSKEQMMDRHFSPEIVFQRAFENYRMLLIIGEPGSGKTTLLKYYAMCCLSNHQYKQLGLNKTLLPIYFPLRELDSVNDDIELLPESLARWSKRHTHGFLIKI